MSDNKLKVAGSFVEVRPKTRLFALASSEPWRSRIMAVLRLLGFRDEQWVRVVMNRETLKLVEAIQPAQLDVLEISGSLWKNRCPFKSYTQYFYPAFDMCADRSERQFDLIVAEQVFEHLLWPYRAVRNVHEMLRPGGYFLVTVPFLIRMHGYPTDCSRWTETGLKHLLAECGFDLETIVTNSWGNASCVKSNLWIWQRYHPLLHSLRNERDFPVNVWALARKLS